MYKNNGILGLFLILVVAMILNPKVLFNLYNNILGRIVLIGMVLFFTMFNVTLGLFGALCLIIASNMFLTEGLDNLTEGLDNLTEGLDNLTVGEDNIPSSGRVSVETKEKVRSNAETKAAGSDLTIGDLQAQSQAGGIDKESIHNSIQSMSSKSIPTDKSNFRSEEVSPSESTTTEPFMSSYANF
jgi:hypothetical protein